jgi:hypothetical protein
MSVPHSHCRYEPESSSNIDGWRFIKIVITQEQIHSMVFILQANYTDGATAAADEFNANFYWVVGVAWSGQRIPTPVNVGFLDRSHNFFIRLPPQLSSRGWVCIVSDPLFLRK